QARAMRLVEGSLGLVVADRATCAWRHGLASRSRAREARHGGDARHGQDRHSSARKGLRQGVMAFGAVAPSSANAAGTVLPSAEGARRNSTVVMLNHLP